MIKKLIVLTLACAGFSCHGMFVAKWCDGRQEKKKLEKETKYRDMVEMMNRLNEARNIVLPLNQKKPAAITRHFFSEPNPAQWDLIIQSMQNDCVEIGNRIQFSSTYNTEPKPRTVLEWYSWSLTAKKQGAAVLKLTCQENDSITEEQIIQLIVK